MLEYAARTADSWVSPRWAPPMLPRPLRPWRDRLRARSLRSADLGLDSCHRRAAVINRVLPLRIHAAGECTGRRVSLCSVLLRQLSGCGGLTLVIVLLPGMPLIGVLVLTQVLNAILLLPLLVLMYLLARDPQVMGRYSVRGDLRLLCGDHWADCQLPRRIGDLTAG